MIRLAQNLFLFIAAVLICAAGSELILHLFYPKYKHAADSPLVRDAVRIVARKPHAHTLQLHPDNKRLHRVRYNNFGMAHSEDFSEADLEQTVNIGLFGDSFIENLRVRWQFPLNRVLERLLNVDQKKFRVLNFGVDGYGTGQSYLYFRHSPLARHLDYALYFLSKNDLRNLYENNLFRIDSQGRLVRNEPRSTPLLIRAASRLHLSYLLLDAWNHVRPDSKIALDDNFYNRMVQQQLLAQAESRAWSPRARALEESLEARKQNADLDRSLAVFRRLLAAWKQAAQSQGTTFVVMLLPRPEEHRFKELLDSELEVIDLYEWFRQDDPDYQYASIRFENDGHWNEKGNKMAAAALRRYFERELKLAPVADSAIEDRRTMKP